jgi:hypothetical protein
MKSRQARSWSYAHPFNTGRFGKEEVRSECSLNWSQQA